MIDDRKDRYRMDRFSSKSLEGNPLKSPAERYIHVYLPPGYYEDNSVRYPVIYFLHGYSSNYLQVTVGHDADKFSNILPPAIMKEIHVDRMAGYTTFDHLISERSLAPFIFVQPDGSLHTTHLKGAKDMFTGQTSTKGSFYVNSPSTGRYEDYIVDDVIAYIEANYRVLAGPAHRALAGASMGGFGALSVCLNRPDVFACAAALSPGNFTVDSISWKLYIPVVEKLLGREFAEESGSANWADILDTVDLVYAADRPLLPTVRRNAAGKVVSWDEEAAARWEKFNISSRIRQTPKPYGAMPLFISCHKDDEFGLAPEARSIHDALTASGVRHYYDLYADSAAALTPHMLGIAYQILPAIRFCLAHIAAL
jgi:S-formylglutathione hydrolase FrmB